MTTGEVAATAGARSGTWLDAIRIYLLLTVVGHLVWETLQLPLYTIWETGTAREQAFAVVHCTGGDILIALSALVGALALAGDHAWPQAAFGRVAVLALAAGVVYTAFSEWLNVEIRQAWAYTEAMPRLPWLGTGLAPLLQWVVVPPLALLAARRADAPGPEAP